MVCGRADGRDVVVDGMLWGTAGKSARYADKLVVPEPLDAVMQSATSVISRQPVAIVSAEFSACAHAGSLKSPSAMASRQGCSS